MLILRDMRVGLRRLKRNSLFKPNIFCERLIMRGGKNSAMVILESKFDIFAGAEIVAKLLTTSGGVGGEFGLILLDISGVL